MQFTSFSEAFKHPVRNPPGSDSVVFFLTADHPGFSCGDEQRCPIFTSSVFTGNFISKGEGQGTVFGYPDADFQGIVQQRS